MNPVESREAPPIPPPPTRDIVQNRSNGCNCNTEHVSKREVLSEEERCGENDRHTLEGARNRIGERGEEKHRLPVTKRSTAITEYDAIELTY